MSSAAEVSESSLRVLEIQRMSTEDGPGIRTTVFLKGCSLACSWCHNPESIDSRPQIQWIESRCIGCHSCLEVCPNNALSATAQGIQIDRQRCEGCGACAEECPSTALELWGTDWPVDKLLHELLKDRAYFEKSGGGVTLSGGEVTLQSKAAAQLLAGLHKEGIHTAIDTCGQCQPEALDRLLKHADLVLFDVKEIDSEKHKNFTGSDNLRIQDNLRHVRDYLQSNGGTLWVRTPIIPGATDTAENIRGIGSFLAEELNGLLSRWELCAFNNLCQDKYLRLGRNWQFANCELMTKQQMNQLSEIARESGVYEGCVHWSGSTQLDEEPGEQERDIQPQSFNPCNIR